MLLGTIVAFTDEARRFFWSHKRDLRERRLPSYKWTKIGNGHYGQAWVHGDYPELVLKISGPAGWGRHSYRNCTSVMECMAGDGRKTLDAWPAYARHCMAHPHEHLPKILHFEQVSQSMSWAVMPRYEPARIWTNSEHEDLFESVQQELLYLTSERDWLWPIITLASALNLNIDLHDENVMVDPSTGKLIITDPFSCAKESSDISGITGSTGSSDLRTTPLCTPAST